MFGFTVSGKAVPGKTGYGSPEYGFAVAGSTASGGDARTKERQIKYDKRNTELKNHRGEETLPFLSGVYENVLLSQSEVEALKSEFPTDWEHRINRLSEYMASTGKRYENHLATIRSWARQDAQSSDRYQHGIYAYDGSESL